MAQGKSLLTRILLGGEVDPSLSKAFGKITKLATAAFSVTAIKNFASESVTAAKDQIEAQAKLEALMRLNMDATDAQIQKIYELTAAQQALGVIGDEVQMAGAQELATYLGLTDSLEKLIPVMNDITAQQYGMGASQESIVSIATMMGKVMMGQTSALSRYGYTFTENQEKILKYGDEAQRAAILAQVVGSSVGGINAALAGTDLGRMQQAQNLLGDMKEEIGVELIPMLADIAEFILPYAKVGFDKLRQGVVMLKPYLAKALEVAGGLADKAIALGGQIIDNWPKIKPIVIGLVAAITAYKVITTATAVATNLMNAAQLVSAATTKAQAAAQLGLNAAFLASPITWIIFGIMALIAVGVLLYKNWDTIKEKASALWDRITGVFGGVGEWFSGLFEKVKSGFKAFVNFIIDGLNLIPKGLNSLSVKVPDWVPLVGGKELGFNIPLIPRLAKGATLAAPTLALLAEAGPETVVPHNNKPRSRALLAEAARGVGAGMGDTYQITYAPVIQGGGEDVGAILEAQFERFKIWIEAYLRKRGRVVFDG